MTEPPAGVSGGEAEPGSDQAKQIYFGKPEFMSWAVLMKRLKARKNISPPDLGSTQHVEYW